MVVIIISPHFKRIFSANYLLYTDKYCSFCSSAAILFVKFTIVVVGYRIEDNYVGFAEYNVVIATEIGVVEFAKKYKLKRRQTNIHSHLYYVPLCLKRKNE